MSDYFDIYCRTCSIKGGVFHINEGGHDITRICHDLAALKEMGEALARLSSDLRLGDPNSGYDNIDVITPGLLEFAIAHAGHDVAARSEYGGFYDKCSRGWICDACSDRHTCDKEPGHADPCGPVVTRNAVALAPVPNTTCFGSRPCRPEPGGHSCIDCGFPRACVNGNDYSVAQLGEVWLDGVPMRTIRDPDQPLGTVSIVRRRSPGPITEDNLARENYTLPGYQTTTG